MENEKKLNTALSNEEQIDISDTKGKKLTEILYSDKRSDSVLSVKNLHISFKTDEGLVHAVRGVSFDLYKGETLCIVGESGSGKSVTSKTIMGILPASAIIEKGSVIFEGEDLTKVDESEFHRIRGHKIGMIFQDPLSSLNPIKKVGIQITEAMLVNSNRMKQMKDRIISKEEAAYKSNEAQRNAVYAKARRAVEESDEYYDKKLNELSHKMAEKDYEVSCKEKGSPEYQDALAEYSTFKSMYPQLKKEILEEKKAEHKKAEMLGKEECKEADATYKQNLPELKAALKLKSKEADEICKKYKIEEKENYQKKLAILQSERRDLLNEKKNAEGNRLAEIDNSLVKNKEEIAKCKRDYTAKFRITKREAKEAALRVMREVGIPQPEVRFKQYPFEFSGGMRQRIVIAIALTANPDVLICDEPTTALDVTIQAQILELINRLKRERNMSIIFITHDLGVVANMADRVAVMYAGKIVEVGSVNEIFYDPKHPYTWALLSSIPDLDSKEKLEAIPGTPPYLLNPPQGDAFAARNHYAMSIDFVQEPPMFKVSDTHYASTWLLDERAPKTEKPRIVSQRIKACLEKAGVENDR